MSNIFTMWLVLTLTGLLSSVKAEEWKLGSMDGYPPFNYYNQSGNYVGVDVSIINAVLAEVNVTPIHVPKPWKRALLDFETGKTDMLFQLVINSERSEKWEMVGPLRYTTTLFMVQKDSTLKKYTSLKDLELLSIGTGAAFKYGDEFDSANFLNKVENSDPKQNVGMLALDRLDVVIGSYLTLRYHARAIGVEEKIRFLHPPLMVKPRYVAFAKTPSGQKKAARFREALNKLRKAGKIEEIIKNWGEKDSMKNPQTKRIL